MKNETQSTRTHTYVDNYLYYYHVTAFEARFDKDCFNRTCAVYR